MSNGNGMDEISIFGETHVSELKKDGSIKNYVLTNDYVKTLVIVKIYS